MVGAVAEESGTARSLGRNEADAMAIKLLDLVTNRYHAGVVRSLRGGAVRVEVPASSRLTPGQRVRCIVARKDSGVLARKEMKRANVLRVETPADGVNLLLELAIMDDPTAS